jgi:cytoskeletal protein RodZ
MFSHTAIVQSSGELPTSLVNRILGGRLKKVKIMHAISYLFSHTLSYALTLLSFFVVSATFGISSSLAQSTSQALSPSELEMINNQPIAKSSSASESTKTSVQRKPSYQYTDKNGTQITEYKDTNSPTQVQVKTRLTTYDMSPPDSVMPGPPSGDSGLLSVPSISIPLR